MFKLSHTLILSISILLISCNHVTNNDDTKTQIAGNNSKTQTLLTTEQEKSNKSNIIATKEKLSQPINQKIASQDLSKMHSQLKQLTKDLSCNNSNQCKIEPIGSRACGGPSSYLVYSSKSANTDTIKQIAAKITQSEKAYNAKNNMVSICQHLTRPSAQCVENKCVKLANTSQETF